MGLFRPYQPKADVTTADPTDGPAPVTNADSAVETSPAPAGRRSTKKATTPASSVAATPASSTSRLPASKSKSQPASTTASDAPAPKSKAHSATTNEPAAAKTTIARPDPGQKKAAATPTRKQALAARQQRLNPMLTKKERRRRDRAERDHERTESMRKMNERPVMMMIRDWVDCRWSFAEFLLPVVLIVIVAPLALGRVPAVMVTAVSISFGLYLAMILDLVIMWLGLRKRIRQFFPNEPLKGKLSYASSRAMLMRRWRQPPAVVKRGSRFVWPRPTETAEAN
ncbi:MAG: DUF3043 domain-containing protein [Propionibacteriaceae bacterium]|nr:DUF3043 domain-containing protein [Propionibacteriaceae bacterium]